MKELYLKIRDLLNDPSKKLDEMQEALNSVMPPQGDGVCFYFLLKENKHMQIFPFICMDEKNKRSYQAQEPFLDEEDKKSEKLFLFLKQEKVYSLYLNRDIQASDLKKYFVNNKLRKSVLSVNKYEENFNLAVQSLEYIVRLASFSKNSIRGFWQQTYLFEVGAEHLESLDNNEFPALLRDDFQENGNPFEEGAIDVTTVEAKNQWLIEQGASRRYFITKNKTLLNVWKANEDLHPEIQEISKACQISLQYLNRLFTTYEKVTFLVAHQLKLEKGSGNKEGSDNTNRVYIFLDDAELDLSYREPHQAELPFLSILRKQMRSERLDSLILRKGVSWFELLSFASEMTARGESQTRVQMFNISVNPIKLGIVNVEEDVKRQTSALEKQRTDFEKEVEKLQAQLTKIQKQGSAEEMSILREQLSRSEREKIEIQELGDKLARENERLKNQFKAGSKTGGEGSGEGSGETSSFQVATLLRQAESYEEFQNLVHHYNLSEQEGIQLMGEDHLTQHTLKAIDNDDPLSEPDKLLDLIARSGFIAKVVEKSYKNGKISSQDIKKLLQKLDPAEEIEEALASAQFLAEEELPEIMGYNLHRVYHPSPRPGGKALFAYHLDPARSIIGLFNMNVTGLAGSLYLTAVKVLFERNLSPFVEEVIYKLQEQLQSIHHSGHDSRFPNFASTVGVLDYIEDKFTYLRAALPYLYKFNGQFHLDKSPGVPRLGLELEPEDYQASPVTIKLEPEDTLIFSTRNFSPHLKDEKLLECKTIEEILKFLAHKLATQDEQENDFDDIYLVALERLHED